MRDSRSFSQYLLKQNNNNQSQIKLLIVVAVMRSAIFPQNINLKNKKYVKIILQNCT